MARHCGWTVLVVLGSLLLMPGQAVGAEGNVIAHWTFDAGQEALDASGNGHDLRLRGESVFVPGGREGSCLESYPAHSDNDVEVGAAAANSPALTPEGAFTIEL